MTIIWCMVPEILSTKDIIFCHSGAFFALLPPYGPRKSKFSKKWKKHLKILSFYKHKWQSYDVWFLRYGPCDRQNFLSFWTIFCLFTPLKTQKIKILKKWKKLLEILSFYSSVPKIMIIFYTVPEIWHVTNIMVIFHFRLFFALLSPNSPKN